MCNYSETLSRAVFSGLRWSIGLLCAAALILLILGCKPKAMFQNVDLTGNPSFAGDFALPDTQENIRTLADFKGKVVILFFGYTHCPDVCPTTLAELANVLKQLGADAKRVQVIFVTVDPARDTPAALERYVSAFGTNFIALRTDDPRALKKFTRSFHVHYAKIPSANPSHYEMEHTAASYVFDPSGQLRLYVRYGQTIASWVHDLRLLF